MFCKNCGAQIDANVVKCVKCGTLTGVAQGVANQRQVSFGEAIKHFDANFFAKDEGRISRSEFWWTCLFLFFVQVFLAKIGALQENGLGIIRRSWWVVFAAYIVFGVRRLHDVGKSGWFLLVPIYNIVLLCFPSENVTNKFGPVPNSLDTKD